MDNPNTENSQNQPDPNSQPDPNATQADPNAEAGQAEQAADPNNAGQENATPQGGQPAPGSEGELPNAPTDPVKPSNDEIHAFRKEVDAIIVKAQELQKRIGHDAGGREISIVVTKLQEGKMWAGKILEAFGSPFPAELADKAE